MIASADQIAYQDRLDYLEVQQRLMERHLKASNPLTPDDVKDLETVIKSDLAKNSYMLKELEGLRIKDGRIHGRANVTSASTDNGAIHRTAAIDFHTTHTYSIVFDNHKTGGDNWHSGTRTTPDYSVRFTHGKLHFNDMPPFAFSKGAQTYLVKQFFPAGKPVQKSLLIDGILNNIDGANYDSDNAKKDVRKTYLNARKALNKTFMAETGIKEELIELFGDKDTGQTRLQINPKFTKK